MVIALQTTEYPIVSTERRNLFDNTNFKGVANIINLGICKVVQLRILRRTNQSLTTGWNTILAISNIPSDIRPNSEVLSANGHVELSFLIDADGVKAMPNSAKSCTYDVSFTYLVF